MLFTGVSMHTILADDFLELVKDASPQEVQETIDAGADVNARDELNARGEFGKTVLINAVNIIITQK